MVTTHIFKTVLAPSTIGHVPRIGRAIHCTEIHGERMAHVTARIASEIARFAEIKLASIAVTIWKRKSDSCMLQSSVVVPLTENRSLSNLGFAVVTAEQPSGLMMGHQTAL